MEPIKEVFYFKLDKDSDSKPVQIQSYAVSELKNLKLVSPQLKNLSCHLCIYFLNVTPFLCDYHEDSELYKKLSRTWQAAVLINSETKIAVYGIIMDFNDKWVQESWEDIPFDQPFIEARDYSRQYQRAPFLFPGEDSDLRFMTADDLNILSDIEIKETATTIIELGRIVFENRQIGRFQPKILDDEWWYSDEIEYIGLQEEFKIGGRFFCRAKVKEIKRIKEKDSGRFGAHNVALMCLEPDLKGNTKFKVKRTNYRVDTEKLWEIDISQFLKEAAEKNPENYLTTDMMDKADSLIGHELKLIIEIPSNFIVKDDFIYTGLVEIPDVTSKTKKIRLKKLLGIRIPLIKEKTGKK